MSQNCPKGDEPCIRGCKGWECRDAHRAYARAVIAEYERINGIAPAQGKETQG